MVKKNSYTGIISLYVLEECCSKTKTKQKIPTMISLFVFFKSVYHIRVPPVKNSRHRKQKKHKYRENYTDLTSKTTTILNPKRQGVFIGLLSKNSCSTEASSLICETLLRQWLHNHMRTTIFQFHMYVIKWMWHQKALYNLSSVSTTKNVTRWI